MWLAKSKRALRPQSLQCAILQQSSFVGSCRSVVEIVGGYSTSVPRSAPMPSGCVSVMSKDRKEGMSHATQGATALTRAMCAASGNPTESAALTAINASLSNSSVLRAVAAARRDALSDARSLTSEEAAALVENGNTGERVPCRSGDRSAAKLRWCVVCDTSCRRFFLQRPCARGFTGHRLYPWLHVLWQGCDWCVTVRTLLLLERLGGSVMCHLARDHAGASYTRFIEMESGVVAKAGLYQSTFSDCHIDDNVLIMVRCLFTPPSVVWSDRPFAQ